MRIYIMCLCTELWWCDVGEYDLKATRLETEWAHSCVRGQILSQIGFIWSGLEQDGNRGPSWREHGDSQVLDQPQLGSVPRYWRTEGTKVPTKLRKHLEPQKWNRQLHRINGSVCYRVIYSLGYSDTEAFAAALGPSEGPFGHFIVNLGWG